MHSGSRKQALYHTHETTLYSVPSLVCLRLPGIAFFSPLSRVYPWIRICKVSSPSGTAKIHVFPGRRVAKAFHGSLVKIGSHAPGGGGGTWGELYKMQSAVYAIGVYSKNHVEWEISYKILGTQRTRANIRYRKAGQLANVIRRSYPKPETPVPA